jgi:hypothetical protein
MISIDWATKVISIEQSDLTLVSGTLYELDVDAFRLELKDLEDSEEGMPFPTTHNHNTEVTLSGVTYARTFEIINGYTVQFEDTGTPYTVRCVGANHNLGDVTTFNGEVSLIIGNSAGLITVNTGGTVAPTAQEIRDAMSITGTNGKAALDLLLHELHVIRGLVLGNPVTITPTSVADQDGDVELELTGNGVDSTVITRQ